jgi:hypothetical protein
MIGKLLGAIISLAAAVCVATVIAAAVLVAYYAQSWKVTKERAGQALAILQGKGPESLLPPPPPKKENEGEQPAYSQLLAATDVYRLTQTQRETRIVALIQQFQSELNKIEAEKKRVQSVSDDLQNKLDEMRSGASSAGMESVTGTLGTLKPSQAKILIQQLLDKGETDVVARMLMGISDSKRPKIIAEFKTEKELDQIGAVLNHIRQGQPTTELLDQTGKKLQTPKGP